MSRPCLLTDTRGSILMEYVLLTGLFALSFLGFVNWLYDPSAAMFTIEGTVAGEDYGILGNAWVELSRRIMHGIGSPTP